MRRSLILLPLLLAVFSQSLSQKAQFSQENAASILKTLVLGIGARPMGSPAEQSAMHFAVSRFREYGCDTAYIMPMTVADGVNTTSGIAIGVKKGRTNRIIVIGGHLDSVAPEVPGANDDGSGTACVIELARDLANTTHESTVLFCCWGGEEEGLRGSEYFVRHFKELDSVELMLQIDMADGAGVLTADPDGVQESAPKWLMRAAFDTYYHDMHLRDLVYKTTSMTWNRAAGGAFGSDHESFLNRGIPAICFTSDETFPIHTPQDNWDNFTQSGLQRAGELVLRLFEKYDGGVPARSTERYQLLQSASHLLFIPLPALWIIIGISSAASFAAFGLLRSRRPARGGIRWSGFKMLLFAFLIQCFIWYSESVIGLIRGYRFPWVNNWQGFVLLGILSGVLGIWCVMQIMRVFRLTADAFVFGRVAVTLSFVFTILAAFDTPELGAYVAVMSLCLSCAVVARGPVKKVVWYVMCAILTYNLLFFDGSALFLRIIALNSMSKTWQWTLYNAGFIVFYGVLSLPLVYGFAALYRDSGVDLLWLKHLRAGGGLVSILVILFSVGAYLASRPVYDRLWYSSTHIEQTFTPAADSCTVVMRCSESLRGMHGRIDGRDSTLTDASNRSSISLPHYRLDWFSAVRSLQPPVRMDSTWSLVRGLELKSKFRPLRIDVFFESKEPFTVSSTWSHGGRTPDPTERETDRRKHFSWYAFPDTSLVVPVTLTVRDTQRVAEEIRVTFDSLAYPMRLNREFTNVSYRTVIMLRDTFSVMGSRRQLASALR